MTSIKSFSPFTALLPFLGACSPAAKTNAVEVTETKVAGMTIIVKRVPNAELATASLRGGARNWTKADAGIEQLAVNVAANGGTQSSTKWNLAASSRLGGTIRACRTRRIGPFFR
jgi:hypothetical protein